jgi:hypothetical protein
MIRCDLPAFDVGLKSWSAAIHLALLLRGSAAYWTLKILGKILLGHLGNVPERSQQSWSILIMSGG